MPGGVCFGQQSCTYTETVGDCALQTGAFCGNGLWVVMRPAADSCPPEHEADAGWENDAGWDDDAGS
jgi:hypothetical protein